MHRCIPFLKKVIFACTKILQAWIICNVALLTKLQPHILGGLCAEHAPLMLLECQNQTSENSSPGKYKWPVTADTGLDAMTPLHHVFLQHRNTFFNKGRLYPS